MNPDNERTVNISKQAQNIFFHQIEQYFKLQQFISSIRNFTMNISIILLMSSFDFSNYQHTLSFDKEFPLLHLSYIPYCPQPSSTSIKKQQNSNIVQETQQFHSPQGNIKTIEQNLRQLHSSSEHHRKCHWTAQQDKLLQRLVQIKKLEWKEIPKFFDSRTQNMCYSRYRRISMSSKDRLWTQEQEKFVTDSVNQLGEKWKIISQQLPKYSAKQIRQRYLNYLRPDIIKQGFTFEEDLKICQFVLKRGKYWRRMESLLPGRSQGCIKGRYYGKLQKIIKKCLNDSNF